MPDGFLDKLARSPHPRHRPIPKEANATAALAGFMINANSIGQASFTARYGRPKAK